MELEDRIDRMENDLATLVGIVTGLAHSQQHNEERFAKLADAQTKLASAQADLDEKFGILVKMMDEWIRNGRK